MRGRAGGSVWAVAAVAVSLFLAAVVVTGIFRAPEVVVGTTAAN